MKKLFSFIKQQVEAVVFIAAVLFLANLVVWWAVFARRVIRENEDTTALYLRATEKDPERLTELLSTLHDKSDRQLTMIYSEAPTFGFLLFIGVVALFVLARARRADQERMKRLLQLTTHELKTPVAGVRALLQSFKLGSIPVSEQPRFLEQGIGECNRLEHLAETILAYQRAVVHQREVSSVVSHTLLGEIIEHRRATFGGEGLTWSKGESVSVLCDKDAVRVVLENLLDNARKYGGGTVLLADRTAKGRWRVEVSDAGEGFDPKIAEALFEPFSRHGNEMTHGSGLGLYLSRQLAQQMGGTVWAKSEGLGKGSTFTLELPLASAHVAMEPRVRSVNV